MSDTPQTDAFIINGGGIWITECEIAMCDFARKLERQRNELMEALEGLLAEYEDRKSQWGDEYLWDKHENKEAIESARAAIAKTKEPQL